MVFARKYIVRKRFEGMPKKTDFIVVTYDLLTLPKDHILVKVEWISVDPYLRSSNPNYPLPYDQFGYQIGIVEESKCKQYPVGTRVVSHQGWCDYYMYNPTVKVTHVSINSIDRGVYRLPNLRGLPISMGIGAIGMPGVAAYFGLLEICKPMEGETVVVTSAAGCVGSIVGQIARIKGCTVIGFTGSDAKVNWLKKELNFHHAFNYKTSDTDAVLKEAAPHGIDCYFDNVGGELSYVIMKQMNDHGRIAICGSISAHNDQSMSQEDNLQPTIMIKQLEVEGFLADRWRNKWPIAFGDLTKWIKNGDIMVREQVTEGFDNIYTAFRGMLEGESCGKAVVKIA